MQTPLAHALIQALGVWRSARHGGRAAESYSAQLEKPQTAAKYQTSRRSSQIMTDVVCAVQGLGTIVVWQR